MESTGHQRKALRGYEVIEQRDAVLPLSNREVFFNFSVYESVKIKEGRALFIEDHLARLFESARRLRMEHQFRQDLLIESIEKLIEADSLQTASLRIQLIGGEEPQLFAFIQDLPVYPEHVYRAGVSVISYHGERVEPEVKSNCLLLNYIALREAQERGAFEAVLVDRNYKVLEGTRSNVFGIREHTLYTPGRGVLEGVTRKYIIEAAEEMGMQVVHAAPTLEELKDGIYEEFFISSTSMGALPVSSVDDVVIGTDFPRTARLHEAVGIKERAYLEGM
jgi:branched-subunit amino acid aminotransferase/4-amino-4-deoxychorismate lyase